MDQPDAHPDATNALHGEGPRHSRRSGRARFRISLGNIAK